MNCPDCERLMDKSMDKKYEYFNCPRCGFEVHRSSWDAMDRYWLKEKYSKYTNLIIWQKLKELRSKGEEKRMKKIEKMNYVSDYNIAAILMKLNEIIDVLNESLSAPAIAKAEKTNAELLVETFKDIATKYSEEDIDNAVALLKVETETANEILRKIMVGKK